MTTNKEFRLCIDLGCDVAIPFLHCHHHQPQTGFCCSSLSISFPLLLLRDIFKFLQYMISQVQYFAIILRIQFDQPSQDCLNISFHLEFSSTHSTCSHSLAPHPHLPYMCSLTSHVPYTHSLCHACPLYMFPSLTCCYDFSYFALFTYVFSLFLEVSHGAAALTHFSWTHITATLLTHSTAVVLTHSIAILIALTHWCSIYSGQSCRLFFSQSLIDNPFA